MAIAAGPLPRPVSRVPIQESVSVKLLQQADEHRPKGSVLLALDREFHFIGSL
jgi:hypothetical protein